MAEHPFDAIARAAGRPISRRRAFGVIGGTFAAGALSALRPTAASAACPPGTFACALLLFGFLHASAAWALDPT